MKILLVSLALFSVVASARPVRGTYEVPVRDELRAYALFDVRFESEDYDRGIGALTLPLPSELTGDINMIRMEQTPEDPSIWRGPKVDARCGKEGRYFVCHMKFNELQTDSEKVRRILISRFSNAADLQAAEQVSLLFKEEPAGILRYKLRGRDRE